MKKITESVKNIVRKMRNLLGRLLQPRPAPALQPVPVHSRRVMRRK